MNELTSENKDCSPRYLAGKKLDEIRQPDTDLIKRIFQLKNQKIQYDQNLKLTDLSNTDRSRYELTKKLQEYETSGYKIYHLTVTYKETEGRAYTVKDIYKFFENMYFRYFLKVVVGNNYNAPSKRIIQPFTLCFIDEHESLRSVEEFADRYHVHVMIAAHPDTVDKLDPLVGKSTLDTTKHCCKNILSTKLTTPGSDCLLYASKMMDKHPDYLCFGGDIGAKLH